MNDTARPTTPRSWLIDRPLRGPALPSGPLARLWGWILLLNRAEHRELYAMLEVGADDRVLEVGYGPGLLAEWLVRDGARVSGVDPSPEMRTMARRRAEGADLRVGTAEQTGLDDRSFDLAVSVNNVPMWSSLADGFTELHRVLRPGGRLVISWHGRGRFALSPEADEQILAELRQVFGNGDRRTGDRIEVFTATRDLQDRL